MGFKKKMAALAAAVAMAVVLVLALQSPAGATTTTIVTTTTTTTTTLLGCAPYALAAGTSGVTRCAAQAGTGPFCLVVVDNQAALHTCTATDVDGQVVCCHQ